MIVKDGTSIYITMAINHLCMLETLHLKVSTTPHLNHTRLNLYGDHHTEAGVSQI